jgi:hypothetical protein
MLGFFALVGYVLVGLGSAEAITRELRIHKFLTLSDFDMQISVVTIAWLPILLWLYIRPFRDRFPRLFRVCISMMILTYAWKVVWLIAAAHLPK